MHVLMHPLFFIEVEKIRAYLYLVLQMFPAFIILKRFLNKIQIIILVKNLSIKFLLLLRD